MVGIFRTKRAIARFVGPMLLEQKMCMGRIARPLHDARNHRTDQRSSACHGELMRPGPAETSTQAPASHTTPGDTIWRFGAERRV
jgi:hypothetical protein